MRNELVFFSIFISFSNCQNCRSNLPLNKIQLNRLCLFCKEKIAENTGGNSVYMSQLKLFSIKWTEQTGILKGNDLHHPCGVFQKKQKKKQLVLSNVVQPIYKLSQKKNRIILTVITCGSGTMKWGCSCRATVQRTIRNTHSSIVGRQKTNIFIHWFVFKDSWLPSNCVCPLRTWTPLESNMYSPSNLNVMFNWSRSTPPHPHHTWMT